MDVVGIVAVEDKELGVALTGGENEAAGLVGKDLAGRFHDSGITKVGWEARWGLKGKLVKGSFRFEGQVEACGVWARGGRGLFCGA